MNWMGNLQQLGRSLMLPTIALPIAAVLLRLGDLPWDVIHASSLGDMLRWLEIRSSIIYQSFLLLVWR